MPRKSKIRDALTRDEALELGINLDTVNLKRGAPAQGKPESALSIVGEALARSFQNG